MSEKTQGTVPVKLGLMPPLTGLVKLYGPEISRAGQIACDEINARGGVLGRPLKLIIEDDGSLPDTAVPAATKLIDEHGCAAIIGNLLSNSRIAVATKVAEPKRVPFLNFSFYEGSIWSRYFFHFAALPNQQIDKMIPYMANHLGPKMYFAGSNYEWPRGSIDAAKRALINSGGEIVGEEYLPIGSDEIDGLLNNVAKSGADVFVPYFAGADQVNLLTRFTEMGLKNRMAVVMGHYDEAMASHLAPKVREGFYSSNTYFMSVDTPENMAYLERMAKQGDVTGLWPNGNGVLTNFGEGTYLCVLAFAKAAENAGSLDPENLIPALERVHIDAPQGPVDMDPLTHHAKVSCYLSKCEANGTFTLIENFGRIDPKIPDRYHHVFPVLNKDTDTALRTLLPFPQKSNHPSVPIALANVDISDHILHSADIAIISIRQDGIIIQVNDCGCLLFGYSEEELVGMSVHHLLPPHMREQHKGHLARFLETDITNINMGRRGEISGYRKDGSLFPAEASISKFQDKDGWVMVATMRDISDRKVQEKELFWQATHDPLTSLPNRALFLARLANALERSKRNTEQVSLLFINLDGFKLINDSYGHKVGDDLLIAIGERLEDTVRPGDTVGRFGGDEFVILSDQVQDINAIIPLAERINKSLHRPLHFNDLQLYATASIGIALGNGNDHLPEDMLRNADSALYMAKDQGRDGWSVFNTKLHEKAKEQLVITNGLRTSLENNELRAVFQPIVDMRTRKIVAAETLMRWYPSDTPISPDKFIPVAERTGSIIPLGEWVFEQVCLTQRALDALPNGPKLEYLSVNVSTRQLAERDLAETFQKILNTTGADPKRILLEITETALMADVNANLEVLHELTALGHKIAIDDFGTGYSSLSQLIRMPVSALKVDKAFVDEVQNNPKKHKLVKAIMSMSQALGHTVIAEGIELEEQFAILQDLGCDKAQGYLFYKPLSFGNFLEALEPNKAHGLTG